MPKIITRAVLAMLASLLAGTASADFIEMDLVGGDGQITLDNNTGLQWLDLTATQGLTWNQAEASNFVTVNGFRHATAGEVTAMFLNAGFLTTNNSNNVANNPAAAQLINLMGCTLFCGTVNQTGRGFAVSSTNVGFTTRPNYHSGGLGAGAAVTSLQTNNKDLVDSSAGHFLVRVAVLSVPEPGSLALMGLGLVGLGLVRRRKRV